MHLRGIVVGLTNFLVDRELEVKRYLNRED